MRTSLIIGAVLALSACATTTAGEPGEQEPKRMGEGNCDASGLQEHVGHKASAESGAILLKLSGAKTLRWGPPDSAWTMDYRTDRLNVSYDREMTITRIACG